MQCLRDQVGKNRVQLTQFTNLLKFILVSLLSLFPGIYSLDICFDKPPCSKVRFGLADYRTRNNHRYLI